VQAQSDDFGFGQFLFFDLRGQFPRAGQHLVAKRDQMLTSPSRHCASVPSDGLSSP
jgi:hypothetical protein